MELTEAPREIIYVGDPMCSWCWGIAPELDIVTEQRPDLAFRVVLGGLRPGPNSREVDDRMAASLHHHWQSVADRSGQPFDYTILDRRGWIYDTEPACKAVVAMRELDEPQAWPLFTRLQRLFYVDGIAPAGREEMGPVIEDFDVDADTYWTLFDSQAAVKATWQDFSQVHKWGIGGFPTVIFREGDRGHVVASGYTGADAMLESLRRAAPVVGEVCGPDELC
ncbi:MAG: DsbA family protein [Acidimicrobiia bacterium]